MNRVTAERSAEKLLRAPIAEWPQLLNSTKADLVDVEGYLLALAQRATLLSKYVGTRYNSQGEQNHDTAAKAANKALTGVRKSLGFAYPKAGFRMGGALVDVLFWAWLAAFAFIGLRIMFWILFS